MVKGKEEKADVSVFQVKFSVGLSRQVVNSSYRVLEENSILHCIISLCLWRDGKIQKEG